jgi:hypothetical protein
MISGRIGMMILTGIWAASTAGVISAGLPNMTHPTMVRSAALSDNDETPRPVIERIDTASDTSPFRPGEQVVLLDDDPPGGIGLKAGRRGTVLCGDSDGDPGRILVSWDLWTNEKADSSPSLGRSNALYPTHSAMWVNPNSVRIGRPFKQFGTIRQGLEGGVIFETDDGKAYNVVTPGELSFALNAGAGGLHFDDRVQIQGLLNATLAALGATPGYRPLDGDIFHAVVSPCPNDQGLPDPFTINLVGNPLRLVPEPNAPGPDYTFDGPTVATFQLNFRAKLSLQITPVPGVGGTWTGTISPDTVGPGTITVPIRVHVEHLDISTLPPGNMRAATVTLSAVPAM